MSRSQPSDRPASRPLRTQERRQQVATPPAPGIRAVSHPPQGVILSAPLVASHALRCPYCRDELALSEALSCPACATSLHVACAAEHPTCTSAGCGERLVA